MGSAFAGKVMTVLGPVLPHELGPVLMREHLYLDLAASQDGPTCPERVDMLRADCVPLLRQMVELGGRSVVDCGTIPHRAESAVYRMLAEMTGPHIVLSTGFYREASPLEQSAVAAQRAHRWVDERLQLHSVIHAALSVRYMFRFTLPRIRELGLEEEAIEQMLVGNPARLLPLQ